jgi:hypothetical protein
LLATVNIHGAVAEPTLLKADEPLLGKFEGRERVLRPLHPEHIELTEGFLPKFKVVKSRLVKLLHPENI